MVLGSRTDSPKIENFTHAATLPCWLDSTVLERKDKTNVVRRHSSPDSRQASSKPPRRTMSSPSRLMQPRKARLLSETEATRAFNAGAPLFTLDVCVAWFVG